MRFTILSLLVLIFISCGGNHKTSQTVGEYKTEKLPDDFKYKIIEDRSDDVLDKNQLAVEINQKITEGQIATLADKLFSSKTKRRRFYIEYLLPEMKLGSGAYARSDYDPDLKINILGATKSQDSEKSKSAENIQGNIIGKWREEQYTSSDYILSNNSGRINMRTIYKSGQISDTEMKVSNKSGIDRYDYKSGGFNGEYFIINKGGELEFYNKDNKHFTTAKKTN